MGGEIAGPVDRVTGRSEGRDRPRGSLPQYSTAVGSGFDDDASLFCRFASVTVGGLEGVGRRATTAIETSSSARVRPMNSRHSLTIVVTSSNAEASGCQPAIAST